MVIEINYYYLLHESALEIGIRGFYITFHSLTSLEDFLFESLLYPFYYPNMLIKYYFLQYEKHNKEKFIYLL